jgi:hypothetical protein
MGGKQCSRSWLSMDSIGSRRPSRSPHDRAELAHEQHGRRLAGVVGRLPVPGAGRIGAAEGVLHGGAQDDRIDAATAFEVREKKMSGGDNAIGQIDRRGGERAQRRLRGHGDGNIRHGGDLGRAGTVRTRRRSLSTPQAQTRSGRPLPLFWESVRADSSMEKARLGGRAYPTTGGKSAEQPKPPRESALFGGDRREAPRSSSTAFVRFLVIIGEEFGEFGSTVLSVAVRHSLAAVGKPQGLGEPAGAVEQPLGLLRHLALLEMVDELR